MGQQIDLSAEAFRPPISLNLRILQLLVLAFDSPCLLLEVLDFHFELPDPVVLVLHFDSRHVGGLDLVVQCGVVDLQGLVAAIELIDVPLSLESGLLQLLCERMLFNLVTLERLLEIDQVSLRVRDVPLQVANLFVLDLKNLVHLALNVLFERLVLPESDIGVDLLRTNEIIGRQFVLQ
jgi:hypothetical protein